MRIPQGEEQRCARMFVFANSKECCKKHVFLKENEAPAAPLMAGKHIVEGKNASAVPLTPEKRVLE